MYERFLYALTKGLQYTEKTLSNAEDTINQVFKGIESFLIDDNRNSKIIDLGRLGFYAGTLALILPTEFGVSGLASLSSRAKEFSEGLYLKEITKSPKRRYQDV